jgi:hypothetical protein
MHMNAKSRGRSNTKPPVKSARKSRSARLASNHDKTSRSTQPRSSRGVPSNSAAKHAAAKASKQGRLIEALKEPRGASIAELVDLTGWQPHTVRGTISGVLRKRLGLNVANQASADGAARVYRIVGSAA